MQNTTITNCAESRFHRNQTIGPIIVLSLIALASVLTNWSPMTRAAFYGVAIVGATLYFTVLWPSRYKKFAKNRDETLEKLGVLPLLVRLREPGTERNPVSPELRDPATTYREFLDCMAAGTLQGRPTNYDIAGVTHGGIVKDGKLIVSVRSREAHEAFMLLPKKVLQLIELRINYTE